MQDTPGAIRLPCVIQERRIILIRVIMGLSYGEKVGCREVLELLGTCDLMALANTVTNKKARVYGKADAINTILEHSCSALELLNRKKVERFAIFQYLIRQHVPVDSQSTKSSLICTAVSHWRTQGQETNDRKQNTSGRDSSYLLGMVNKILDQSEQKRDTNISNQGQETNDRKQNTDSRDSSYLLGMVNKILDQSEQKRDINISYQVHQINEQKVTNASWNSSYMFSTPKREYQQDEQEKDTHISNQDHKINVQKLTTASWISSCLFSTASSHNQQAEQEKVPHTSNQVKIKVVPMFEKNQINQILHEQKQEVQKLEKITISSCDCEAFGNQFCKWFYLLLNSQNPFYGQEKRDWGPEHFCEDAVLVVCSHNQLNRTYTGAHNVSSCFCSFTQEERVLFQPNFESGGIRCEILLDGQVTVTVAGTVCSTTSYLGKFEQIFKLLADKNSRKWKISYAELKIVG
ncbi:uncharacterized protein C3orf38-like isoform X2 [Pyxicephalus adspersus]|uniref:uncharacterized protein C3orf38-like isoform X2 n=1 Tax=Pyxicephalus adspersus TaxID=30357 RepID=UPI003B5AC66A